MNTQTTEIRVRKNFLGKNRPPTVEKQLIDILVDKKFYRYNLKPPQQRGELAWPFETMLSLINSVMDNRFIPEPLVYEYQEGENEQYDYEVLDGQHRLFTLKAFFDSKKQKLLKRYLTYINI